MSIVTGDRYLDLLACFVENQAGGLLDGSLILKLNPVGLHYVQTRLDALHELEMLRTGAPVDYLRAYISDLGDHRALEQLSRVLSLLPSLKVVSVLPSPARDPCPLTLSPFGRLKSLELRGCDLSTTPARGLLQLRPILERLICHNSADALRHIFTERIQEVQKSQVWTRLAFVSCSTNGMILMDDSLQLLPAVQFLDLSRNRFAKAANLQCCLKLKYLDLGFNQLRDISALKQITSQITKLVLKNNALVSVHGIAALTSLEAVDLSNNLISKFNEIQSIAVISSLKTIFLEGNPISTFKFYREEVFSYFFDPTKVYLDGKKVLKSEIWRVNKIILRRQKLEVLYGSYTPAATLSDMQHVSDIEDSIPRRKLSRLALIHDAQIATNETEEDESAAIPSGHSKDMKERRQELVDETDQNKLEAIQLMQKAEALKEENSTTWLQELRHFLDDNELSSEQPQSNYDMKDGNFKLLKGLKSKELGKVWSRRSKRRQHKLFKESLTDGQENQRNFKLEIEDVKSLKDYDENSSFCNGAEENNKDIVFPVNPKMPNTQFAFDDDTGVSKTSVFRNIDENVQHGLGYAADEEQTSMDESFGSWKPIDEMVDSQEATSHLMSSPPHYHKDVLQKRQDFVEEFLRFSLDSRPVLSSSESSSSNTSFAATSSSSSSNEHGFTNRLNLHIGTLELDHESIWQHDSESPSSIEDANGESSSEHQNKPNRGKTVGSQESITMLDWQNIPKEKAAEALHSNHLNPACTDDIRANAGGGEDCTTWELNSVRSRLKKPRRAKIANLHGKTCLLEENTMLKDYVTRKFASFSHRVPGVAENIELAENENSLFHDEILASDQRLKDPVEEFFMAKIANAEGEICINCVKCGCIRLWEELPQERGIDLLLSNKNQIYMLLDFSMTDDKLKGSDCGFHVIASHSIHEVKKVIVGLGLQTLRIDIGHSASYLLLTRDRGITMQILEMFWRQDSCEVLPSLESWEQKQLDLFEKLVLGGAKSNLLMYFMSFFREGDLSENPWAARTILLISHYMFVCIEDLSRFANDLALLQKPYFIVEAVADVHNLLEVSHFPDDVLIVKFEKIISHLSGNYSKSSQKPAVWKFTGLLKGTVTQLVALMHALHPEGDVHISQMMF